jgi:hypothetical protein
MSLTISVENADIVDFACDVLVLKYAQAFYGTDALVANLLRSRSLEDVSPRPSKYALLSSEGKLAAKNVLFVGVLPLIKFDYGQIREFASYSLQILAQEMSDAEHVAMTIHGVGYGLDEKESFLAQIGGLFDAAQAGVTPSSLVRITIIERNQGRASRLKQILENQLPSEIISENPSQVERVSLPSKIAGAGLQSNIKPHIFVAMPFSEEMEDVYIFGIQGPVNAAGYLCERVDMATFTGDILIRIKSRIETAALVVADLTGANANVYLEVGYAWGKDRPTLLLTKKSDELKFDVRGQRCIVYKNIADLAKKLETDLAVLK